MGKESEIINEFKKIFKESKVHSTLRNIYQKLEDIKGFDKNLIKSLKSYVDKSEQLKRMALNTFSILAWGRNLETEYHFSKLPFKDKLIEAFKDTDEDYAQQLTKDLDRIEKVFEPVPDLLKQLEEINKPDDNTGSECKAVLKEKLELAFTATIAYLFSRTGGDEWYYNYKYFVESSYDPNDKNKFYRLKPDDKEKLIAEAKAINVIYKSASKSTDITTLIKIMKDLKDKLDEFKPKLEKAWKDDVDDKTIDPPRTKYKKDYTDLFLFSIRVYNQSLSSHISKLEEVYKKYGPPKNI